MASLVRDFLDAPMAHRLRPRPDAPQQSAREGVGGNRIALPVRGLGDRHNPIRRNVAQRLVDNPEGLGIIAVRGEAD